MTALSEKKGGENRPAWLCVLKVLQDREVGGHISKTQWCEKLMVQVHNCFLAAWKKSDPNAID